MKTTHNHIRIPIRQHIFDSIEIDDNENATEKEKIEYAAERYESEYNYPNNQKRIPNNQARFIEYLQGLPFNFEFYYYAQRQFLESIGLDERSKQYTDQEVADLYYNLIYREFSYLCRKHKINF